MACRMRARARVSSAAARRRRGPSDDYRGQRLLLVFWVRACPACEPLAPLLEALERRSSDPRVLIISRGDPEADPAPGFPLEDDGANRPSAGWEVARRYDILGAPIGYLIDEHGRIAGGVAVGVAAILEHGASGRPPDRVPAERARP